MKDTSKIKADHFEAFSGRETILIVKHDYGYQIHHWFAESVAPISDYDTAQEAGARALQLLGITEPVQPQSWPEVAQIGGPYSPPPKPRSDSEIVSGVTSEPTPMTKDALNVELLPTIDALKDRCFTFGGKIAFMTEGEAFDIALTLKRAGLLPAPSPVPPVMDREVIARIIAASCLGQDDDNLYWGKAEWTFDRGARHDVNTPYKADCLEAADAIIAALSPQLDKGK